MTNKHTHQIHALVFSRQSHTAIVQILVSSGPAATIQRAQSGGVAGMLRSHPLDVLRDISRASARLPADQAGEWPRHPTHINPGVTNGIRNCTDSAPTQSRLSRSIGGRASHQRHVVPLAQFDSIHKTVSRANITHPNSESQTYTSGPTNSRGASPIDPDNFRKAFMPAKRPSRGVRQDKGVLTNDRLALRQPAPPANTPRSHRTPTKSVRSQTAFVHKHKTVPLPLHVDPLLKAEVQRVAEREALSVSQVGAIAVSEWAHRSIRGQHEDTLYPIMRNLVREENRTLGNRLVFFQMRTAFASEQTRILTTNILSRFLKYLGVPDETFNNLVDQSNKMAKRNIIARNPDFKSLIEEWWQTEPDQNRHERADEKQNHKPQPNRKEKR